MNDKNRPRIKIESKTFDYIIEAIGLAFVVVLLIMPAYFYNQLPDQIPYHYNFHGQPNAYSGKDFIWLLPLVGLVLYVLLSFVSRYPHTFNYPVQITRENVYRVYRIGVRSMRIIKVAIIIIFAALNFRTIQIGLKMNLDLGVFLLPLGLFIIIVIVLVLFYQMVTKTR